MQLDITGQRFGRLVAMHPTKDAKGHRRWLCRCDCGGVVSAIAGKLRIGHISSCGCLRKDKPKQRAGVPLKGDLAGKKFGRLTVLRQAADHGGRLGIPWICECECGTAVIAPSSSLLTGKKRSCGCLIVDTRNSPEHKAQLANVGKSHGYTPGESAFRRVLRNYQAGAKKAGRAWALTDAEVRRLFASPCHYCGVPPSRVSKIRRGRGHFVFNGIDRVDSSGGYTPDNVVTCCSACNVAKLDREYGEFLAWVDRVWQRLCRQPALTREFRHVAS